MTKRKQPVFVEIKLPGNHSNIFTQLEGTNDGNLQSKICAWVKLMLVQYNVDGGATMTVVIHAAEPDEFSNPER